MATLRTTPPAIPQAYRCAAPIGAYLDAMIGALSLPENLRSAIRYAMDGGKLLRPVLAWHSCAACGGEGEASLHAGAAVELIHAFSLVHDDLPAMDDDDLRRGRPTLHIHAGEAMAILAGDAMVSLAFQTLATRSPDASVASALLAELAGATTDMIAGQVYDTLGGFPPGLDGAARLALIHRNKTGALIRASCRMGALCAPALAGAPSSKHPELSAISTYADAIGLMFQIVDDLLDVEQTSEHTGKRTRKDASAGKLTFPGVLGVEASRREVRRLEHAALDAILVLGPRAEPLAELCRYMAVRTS